DGDHFESAVRADRGTHPLPLVRHALDALFVDRRRGLSPATASGPGIRDAAPVDPPDSRRHRLRTTLLFSLSTPLRTLTIPSGRWARAVRAGRRETVTQQTMTAGAKPVGADAESAAKPTTPASGLDARPRRRLGAWHVSATDGATAAIAPLPIEGNAT